MRRLPRPALLAIVALLALTAIGIAYALSGGDSDEGGGGSQGAASEERREGDGSQDGASEGQGDGGGASEERQASDAVLRHFRAIRAGDGAAACAELSPAGRRSLVAELRQLGASGECEEAVLDLQVPELRVEDVRIAGERAIVVLAGGLEYELERIDGEWKLTG